MKSYELLEDICKNGCKVVREVIVSLEGEINEHSHQDDVYKQLHTLDIQSRDEILEELRAIMIVYDQREQQQQCIEQD